MLIAFALRFHLLGEQSLWNDEGNSYVQATRSLSAIAENAARDIHPPGYYWLLHGWRILTGDTEFALRSLSAFASVLTVALTFALGRRLYGPLAGLAAALFVALNTFHIYYAQEARMYALLALWGVAGMWALVGFLSPPLRPSPLRWGGDGGGDLRWALGLALINAAGLWTQYAYPFVMLVQGVVFLMWFGSRLANKVRSQALTPAQRPCAKPIFDTPSGRWTSKEVFLPFALREKGPGDEGNLSSTRQTHIAKLVYYLAANGLTLLLFLPWLPTALHQVTSWPNTGTPVPLNIAVQTILGWFTFGVTFAVTDASWVAIALLLLLLGLRVERPVVNLWRVLLPVIWALLPVILFLALGMFREENLKLLLPAQIGYALWLGRGVWVLWHIRDFHRGDPRIAPTNMLSIVAALAIVLGLSANLIRGLDPLYTHPDYQRDDYRAMVEIIAPGLSVNDAVILDAPNQEEVFRYYYDGPAPVYPLPPGLGGDDAATQAQVEAIIDQHERIFVLFWGEAERDPNRIVETTLDNQAFEIGSQWYGDVRLVRYVTPAAMTLRQDVQAPFGDSITLESYALSTDTLSAGHVLQLQLRWRTDSELDTRYKVFVQLLDENGQLVAQRDSEPGGGLALTTTWPVGATITDNHALLIPNDLAPSHYALITGLYDNDDPQQRLHTGDTDHLLLTEIQVE